MDDFDDDPLDLLDDDGDGVIEMGLFFDEDEKNSNSKKPSNNSGCSVILLAAGVSLVTAGLVIPKLFV